MATNESMNVDELGDEIRAILDLGPEKDDGNVEYKRSLLGKGKERQLELETQMRYRMEEGNGQCTYVIGVEDDGVPYGLTGDEYKETREVLEKIAKRNDYSLRLLTTSKCERRSEDGKISTNAYEFLVRENNTIDYEEVKIATGGNVDSAKCEGRDTKIRMYSGSVKNIQDIEVGDLLMGDDGNSRNVLEVTKGWGQMYKIIPVNGTPLIVNKNHILCFKASNYNYVSWENSRQRYSVRTFVLEDDKPKLVAKTFLVNPDNGYYPSKNVAEIAANIYLHQVLSDSKTIKLGDVVELTLGEFVKLPKNVQSALKLYRVGVEFKKQPIELDPYMLGYWLGDGNSNDSIITTAEREVIEYFADNLSQYKLTISHECRYRYSIRPISSNTWRGGNHFRNCLKKYNLYKNKHIPDCYKYNTRDSRLRLLAGLIDSDGTLSKTGGYTIAMAQKNRILVNDIIELSRSLGFASYPYDRQVICTNGKYGPVECYAIRFSINGEGIEQIPVVVPRKKSEPRKSPKNVLVTGVKNIEILQDQEYFGFELDGNGRYLHEDYTVTHNSSTIGVLISGQLDDGRGSARAKVFNFKHELQSGRTSSIAQQILGYDPEGNIVNHDSSIKKMSWPEISSRSSKIIKFFDLCGHSKYTKTTIRGMISNSVDYAIITVGANMGARGNTREHISICLTLRIPIIIFLTKIDLGEKAPDEMKKTLADIKKIFSQPGARKMIFTVENMSDVITAAKSVKGGDIVPLFKTSNVRGDGLQLVHEFLNIIRPRLKFDSTSAVELHIGETFMPVGIGLVIGGFLKRGVLMTGHEYFLGPMGDGSYKKVKCRSLHVNRTLVQSATPGRYVCVSIPKVERNQVSKGMVIVSDKEQCLKVKYFFAEVIVYRTHHTTIRVGYETMVHVNSIRAVAKLVEIKEKKKVKLRKSTEIPEAVETEDNVSSLSLGDRAIIRLQFKQRPRYLSIGDRVLLAESRIKMTGRVVEIETDN